MSRVHATRVDVVTDSGLAASVDFAGWHCTDDLVRDRLMREVPIDASTEDPLHDAARRACELIGARIVTMKRKAMTPAEVDTASRLYRALTESALQRALGEREPPPRPADAPPPSVERGTLLLALVLLGVAVVLAIAMFLLP